MTQKTATLACIGFLVFGCSRSAKVQRSQQDYQTVQEGSASGVTSTINAPGETTPPLTNTNADTTTNLTLPTNPNPLGTDTAGGSMASAIPSGAPGMPPAARPRPATRPAPVANGANAPVVTDTVGSTTPAMPRQRAPQPSPSRNQRDRQQTDTAATDTAAPPAPTDTAMTDTSSTTSTSSSTDPKKKTDDGKKDDSDQQQPPPPPPPTDTHG